MEFKINKSSEFPIYQQLKEQIKFYLLSGALQPGTKVPTPKDLGLYLQINRNTVIAAYKELEQEGLLMTKQGQGTYVAENLPSLPRNEGNRTLMALAQETIERTKELGFTPEELFTIIFNKTILGLNAPVGLDAPAENSHKNRPRALMVECNQPDLQHYQNTLQTELKIQVDGCLLHELPDQTNEAYVKNADFIVTNITHLEDVKAIFEPLHKEVFGMMAIPHFHTFMEIGRFPTGVRVGLVCVNKAFAAKTQKALEDAGINHITMEHCGTDDLEAFNQMIKRVDYIISTRVVIDIVRKIVPAGIKIIEYPAELDRAGIEMLKQFLATHFNLQ